MSLLPYTSLIVNKGGVDVLGHQPDVVYLMAPANKGGEKKDANGDIILTDELPTFSVSAVKTNLRAFEAEFGLANEGSPASIYAKWIYDYGHFAIKCRRVVSDDIAFASTVLQNIDNKAGLKAVSTTKDYFGNDVFIDVDVSSGVEHYLGNINVLFEPVSKKLNLLKEYESSDLFYFEGSDGNKLIRASFFGGEAEYFLFSVSEFVSIETLDGKEFGNAGDDKAVLEENEFSWQSVEEKFVFGSDISLSKLSIIVKVLLESGELVHYYLTADSLREVSLFLSNITFDCLYLNEIGTVSDVKLEKLMRLYNNNPLSRLYSKVEAGGVYGGEVGTIALSIWNETKSERYIGASVNAIVEDIDNNSRLVIAESYINSDILPDFEAENEFVSIGVKITAYNGAIYEVFDNIVNALEAENIADTNLVTFEVVGTQKHQKISYVMGQRLSGGSSGLTPIMVNYLEAIAEAETVHDITIVIAPGVSDTSFHLIMKDHCERMCALGRHRTSFGGVALDETIEMKLARTEAMSSECFSLVSDGLKLKDPVSSVKKIFSGAISVAPLVGLLLSQVYYSSLTFKKIMSAYGVEHNYDDAELEELHQGRMITFQFEDGVKILDGITTSNKNAYEDIHMVRVFHTISQNLKVAMEKAAGKSNMPTTWGYVLGLMNKYLDGLVVVGAIISFKLLNEVRVEDMVAKLFRFRVGIIPVFPVKYIEGVVDIVPPTFIEV